jgi:hypothetical protein
MRAKREHRCCYPFRIARCEIKHLVDNCGMCCYANFGYYEMIQEFNSD